MSEKDSSGGVERFVGAMLEYTPLVLEAVDRVVAETDAEDRIEVLLVMHMHYLQGWYNGVMARKEQTDEVTPKMERMMELMERYNEELDDGEDWKE